MKKHISDFDRYLDVEESFLKDSKQFKKQRKQKSLKDRSKYKKTNLEKQKNEILQNPSFEKAIVLSITGNEILVSSNSKKYICTLRGNLKKEKTRNKNIIAVGDIVNITKKNEKEASIETINQRYSILSRIEDQTNKRSIIAANIDQVLIISSILKPSFKPALIDRYIIACQKENMKPVIVINKIDLLEEDSFEKQKYFDFINAYEKLGFVIISISCKTKLGLDNLLNIMKGKTSVFSGQSGTGKSSIINEILKTDLKTADVQKKSYKGAHITTKSSLLEIKEGGFCIDTPGIKSFGIWELKIEDIRNYFFEIEEISKKCKYQNCMHLNEPNCYIQKAIEENKVSKMRFESYKNLMNEINKKESHE